MLYNISEMVVERGGKWGEIKSSFVLRNKTVLCCVESEHNGSKVPGVLAD